MKILYLTNNSISYSLSEWLKKIGEDVFVYDKKLSKSIIFNLKPDFIISYNYGYLIPKDILSLFPKKNVINLHISLLPWNRGSHPNVWSFIDETPKGVSIHLIDEGIDTGDILVQKEVFIDENKHTLESSYKLLHKKIQSLFKDNWYHIKILNIEPKPQQGKGSIHYKKDFEKIKHLLGKEGWNIPILEFKKRVYKWREENGNKIRQKNHF